MKTKLLTLFIVAIGMLNSCTTYLISEDSFRKQFTGIDSTKLKQVIVRGPVGEVYKYPANPIKTILCVDKNGNQHELENKPSIEIRFTHGQKNKKTIFYFDRVILENNMIIGVKSRFVSSTRETIPLNEVTKIEVQDGKKNFHYENK